MGARHGLHRSDARRALAELRTKGLNFDPDDLDGSTPGWRQDENRQALPGEAPGPPVAGGSWEVARRLARDYEFVDPARIQAVYDPAQPLEERDMLLVIRFWGLRLLAGVRVGDVYEERRRVSGRPARLWGWTYLTLAGHIEMGKRHVEVWKWEDTGEVEFRTYSVSRVATRNPLLRLGFRLFGRRRQEEFGRQAGERMARLTALALAGGEGGSG